MCRDDLGMGSGSVLDAAIDASSSYDFKSVGPQNSRSVLFIYESSGLFSLYPFLPDAHTTVAPVKN